MTVCCSLPIFSTACGTGKIDDDITEGDDIEVENPENDDIESVNSEVLAITGDDESRPNSSLSQSLDSQEEVRLIYILFSPCTFNLFYVK